jgi:hypothetical protein
MLNRRSIALAAAVASLAVAAPAYATVTIGSNLGSPANSNSCGAADCTTTNLVLNGDVAPNGLTSPVTGTVTSWRFKSASAGNTIGLRVLRPAAATTFTGAGSSTAVTSAGTGIEGPFATSLPITAGDHIGLNRSNGAIVLSTAVGSTQLFWTMPVLGDGETRAATVAMNQEVLVQAVVEPSNTLTIGKPKLNKRNGSATFLVSVPNPGLISFSCNCVKLVGSQNNTAAGSFKFILLPRSKNAKKLKETGKATIKPKFAFTPTNGVTGPTQARKIKLKRNV